jgi:hypothetical protein
MKKLWYIVGAILLLVGLFEARAYAQNQTGVLTRLVSSTLRFSDGTFGLKVAISGSDGTLQSVGGGTQYAEDDAHASGNTGTLALAVRNDAGTALAADGDNSILQVDNTGALRVTGGGGGTQYAEDAAHADGNTGTLALGVRRDAAASSTATDGDNATLNLDSTGRLWSNTELLDAAALADNTANPTITGIAAYLMCYDGATWDRCAVSTDVVEDAPETAGGSGPMVLNVRRDVAASSAGANLDNATFNSDALGLLWTRSLDPCSGVAKSYIPIDIVTATTTELTAALAGASTHYYICSLNLVTAGANNVALVDDNTDGCGSPTAGVMGGFGSAAEGWNFAANGGLTLGSGSSSVGRTTTANAVLCLITSAAVQLSGHIVVAAAP